MGPPGMSLTGGRNSRGRCRAPEWMFRRCPPGRIRSAPKSQRPDFMSEKTIHRAGIILNGVTGRMGLNQHLRRSLYAIIQQGGLALSDREAIMPDLLLVGRSTAKLEAISKECGGLPWTTNLDEALANQKYSIYFDAQTTDRRADAVRRAIAAGKH